MDDGNENNASTKAFYENFSGELIFDGYSLPCLDFEDLINPTVGITLPIFCDQPPANEETSTDVPPPTYHNLTNIPAQMYDPQDIMIETSLLPSPDPDILDLDSNDIFEEINALITSIPVNNKTSNQNTENQVKRNGELNLAENTKNPIPPRNNELTRFAKNVTFYDQGQFKGLQIPLPPSIKFRRKIQSPNESKRTVTVEAGNPNVNTPPTRPTSAETTKKPNLQNRSTHIKDNSVSCTQSKTPMKWAPVETKKRPARICAPIKRYCDAESYSPQPKRKEAPPVAKNDDSIQEVANAGTTKNQTGCTHAETNKTSSQLMEGKCSGYKLTIPRLRRVNHEIVGFTEHCRLSAATLNLLARKLRTEEVEKVVTTDTDSTSKKDVRRQHSTSEVGKERSQAVDEQDGQQSLLNSMINSMSKGKPSGLKGDGSSLERNTAVSPPASISTDLVREKDRLYIADLVKEILSQNQPTLKKSCSRKGDKSNNNRKVHFALENSFQILDDDICRRVNFHDYYTLDSDAVTEGKTLTNDTINNILTWHTDTWFQKYAQHGCKRPPLNEIKKRILQDPQNTAIEKFKRFFKEDMYLKMFKLLYKAWSGRTDYIVRLHIESIIVMNEAPHTNLKIKASRKSEKNSTFKEEIQEGDVVILNLGARCVFAYVTETEEREKYTLIIKPLNLKLENLTIQAQVLINIKRHLRQLHALTYLPEAPLADALFDESDANLDHEDRLETAVEDEQKRIVAACVNDICNTQMPSLRIIDGPPGTGKTQVIMDLIKELFSEEDQLPVDLKILVVTSSDSAADDVCDRLKNQIQKEKMKVSLLRFGNIEYIDSSIHDLTLESLKQGEETTSYDIELEAQIMKSRLNAKLLEMRNKEDVNLRIIIQNLENDYRQLRDQNEEAVAQFKSRFKEEIIFARTNVVVTSLKTCWSNNFEKFFISNLQNEGKYHKFTFCIMDDAHVIKLADLLLPITTMVRTVLLIGDSVRHELMADTNITSTKNMTPFQRLVRKTSTAVVSFKNQYRMNSKLLSWFEPYFKIKFTNPSSSNDDFILKPFIVFNLISKETDEIHFRNKLRELMKYIVINTEKLIENNDFLKIGIVTEDTGVKSEIENMFRTSKKVSVVVGNAKQFCGVQKQIILIPSIPMLFGKELEKWLYVAMTRGKNSIIICDNFSKVTGRKSIDVLVKMASIRRCYFTWCYDNEIKDFPFIYIKSNKKSATKN